MRTQGCYGRGAVEGSQRGRVERTLPSISLRAGLSAAFAVDFRWAKRGSGPKRKELGPFKIELRSGGGVFALPWGRELRYR